MTKKLTRRAKSVAQKDRPLEDLTLKELEERIRLEYDLVQREFEGHATRLEGFNDRRRGAPLPKDRRQK